MLGHGFGRNRERQFPNRVVADEVREQAQNIGIAHPIEAVMSDHKCAATDKVPAFGLVAPGACGDARNLGFGQGNSESCAVDIRQLPNKVRRRTCRACAKQSGLKQGAVSRPSWILPHDTLEDSPGAEVRIENLSRAIARISGSRGRCSKPPVTNS